MVEGGTLLRCYTSQRGIEGSNPSSSASEAARLQEQRVGEEKGPGSLLALTTPTNTPTQPGYPLS